MGVFGKAAQSASQEKRIAQLSFISPPVGAHVNAVQELYGTGSPEQAMYHSAAWACSDLIASSLSMMQPWAYRVPSIGVSTPAAGGPGPSAKVAPQPVILNLPGATMDIGDWLWACTWALVNRGNVYGKIVARDPKLGYPTQIELWRNEHVQVREISDGSVEYKYRGQLQDPATIWHQAIFRPPGSPTGMSVLRYAQRATRMGLNAEEFGDSFFTDGGHPTALLLNDKEDEFSQEDAQTVKQKFLAALHGSREPVVMTGGWNYQQIQTNPQDSQFLDTQKLSDGKICRFYRVMPEMVGVASEGSSITYANVEQRALDFMTYTMQRWITWFERKLGSLTPNGQFVKFDLSPLLRTDIYTRWRVNHAQVASRVMAIDEVRQGEDLPPLTPEQIDMIKTLQTAQPIPAIAQGLSAFRGDLENIADRHGRTEIHYGDLRELESICPPSGPNGRRHD